MAIIALTQRVKLRTWTSLTSRRGLSLSAPWAAAATGASGPARSDQESIQYLEQALEVQKKAFLQDQYPSVQERQRRLQCVADACMAYKKEIHNALVEDFGYHPEGISNLMETLGPVGRALYDKAHVQEWMQDEQFEVDRSSYGEGKAWVRREPKGVIGLLVPFNFPMTLALSPLCEMLAAGNRVIIKPSETTPRTSQVTRDLIQSVFPKDLVDVVPGGVDVSRHFGTLKWDHLMCTSSPAIGKAVMAAAAQNLVPLTLELGGKCPSIFTSGAVTERNVSVMMATKALKNGQMCVAPDTTYVPASDIEAFVGLAKDYFDKRNPGYTAGADSTAIVSDRHLQRLLDLRHEAKASGARVVDLEPDIQTDPSTRKMPQSLVINPAGSLRVTQEEIFGPLMSVIAYDSLDTVIEQINAGERPLGLYVFSDDRAIIDHVINNTTSGGVSVNTCAAHGAVYSMGFGGIGQSGMGRHQGYAGFCEFTNPKGIFERGKAQDGMEAWGPPYSVAKGYADSIFDKLKA